MLAFSLLKIKVMGSMSIQEARKQLQEGETLVPMVDETFLTQTCRRCEFHEGERVIDDSYTAIRCALDKPDASDADRLGACTLKS